MMSCFLRQLIQQGSTGNHPARVWIHLKRLSCATLRASQTDGCTLWESQWPSPRQLSGNAKGPGRSWLKQTIFKRVKVMRGVHFSGIVGADGKYWCLSSNGSAGKKKMWLLCVSLHPFLFKCVCVPKCQVKPNQLMATGSWCFGCGLRCSDASGTWKVKPGTTTRCK